MSLTLFYHPLSSYCHKVLIALYETGADFTPVLVDLGDPASSAEMKRLWPVGKFPVIRDEADGRVVPESTIIIEYLNQHFPEAGLIPADADLARQTRLRDRFYDNYVHSPLQKVTLDVFRPADGKDPIGVAQAKAEIERSFDMLVGDLGDKTWMMGEAFTLADCSAAPALFYASRIVPFGERHAPLAAYLERLKARPSYARTLAEAKPYFHMLPI